MFLLVFECYRYSYNVISSSHILIIIKIISTHTTKKLRLGTVQNPLSSWSVLFLMKLLLFEVSYYPYIGYKILP